MKIHEMEGFLRSKCFPGDMRVNETTAQYLCRIIDGLKVEAAHRQAGWNEAHELSAKLEAAEKRIAELESRTVTVKLPEPYAYLRENNGKIQISIGAERPSDRSGGYATPWFAIYTAAGIKAIEGDAS